MKRNYFSIAIAIGLILMATTARIVNSQMHLYNFAPVAALGLFCGATIKDKRVAFMMAILAQLCADLYFQLFTGISGFYGISQLFVYGGLLGAALLGVKMNEAKITPLNVFAYSVGASTLFFLVSNLGVWLSGLWGTGFSALAKTFVMAIPFFKNSLIGDLVGSTVLFSAYYLLQAVFAKRLIKAKV